MGCVESVNPLINQIQIVKGHFDYFKLINLTRASSALSPI